MGENMERKNIIRKAFRKNGGILRTSELIISFISPPYEFILLEDEFFKDWICEEGRYI